jgi:hypothetical protein
MSMRTATQGRVHIRGVALPRRRLGEVVAGKPFDEFLEERIFRPLGMVDGVRVRHPCGQGNVRSIVADTWITHMADFLDERGQLPSGLPGPARLLAEHLGAIVASVTSHRSKPSVRCRRRPGHTRCSGEVDAALERDGVIRWACPACGDNGYIRGWQGTLWDCRVSGMVQ